MILDASPIFIPPVASHAAIRRLADQLELFGVPADAASTIARSCVDPADVRRRLASPDRQRTSGATLLTISAQVWTPLISVFPDNKRTSSEHPLPIDGSTTPYPLLPEPEAVEGTAELIVEAESMEQLLFWMAEAEGLLRTSFSLADRIGAEGILRPLTLLPVSVDIEREPAPVILITSLDGSSRVASAHQLLHLSAGEVVERFGRDDRLFRRYLGEWRRLAEDGRPSDDETSALRVLVAPADLVVAVEATGEEPADALAAARAFVGLLHVQPPTAWREESQLDALGGEVVDMLSRTEAVDRGTAALLRGAITLDEAAARDIARSHDERAAVVLRTLIDHRPMVVDAIRRITHLTRVRRTREVAVAVELIMRSFRHNVHVGEARRSRVAMQLAYAMPELWNRPWQPTSRTPDELHDAALVELAAEQTGPATLELAVKGGYELMRARILAQISLRRGVTVTSLESPVTLLRRLATSRHGLEVLSTALISGREGRTEFPVVDRAGTVEETRDGPAPMDADWLRETFGAGRQTESPAATFAAGQERIRRTTMELDEQTASLMAMTDDAGPLARFGWSPDDAGDVLHRLDRVTSTIRSLEVAHLVRMHTETAPTSGQAEDIDQ